MSNWSALVHTALLGTRREAPPAPRPAPGLEPLLEQMAAMTGAGAERRLLGLAGALDLYEQIGRAPARGAADGRPGPLADDDLPICTPAAADALAQLLEGPLRKLLPEFLGRLAAQQRRAPPALLPNLLAIGAKTAAMRPAILPVIGRQGRWLAARNPEWAYAAASSSGWSGLHRIWANSTAAQRSALVQQLRATDPERGRALFENSWRAENDHTRLRLIKLLAEGLSMADEPLLETALDDRSHLVRREAAEMLSCLPDSRLSKRMASYVPAYLTWTPKRQHAISISLPVVSPAMRRDGIIGLVSKEAARVRSQEIVQLVSAVPLETWEAIWGPPRTVVAATRHTLWPRTLITGLATAAIRQRDPVWAGELVRAQALMPSTNRLVPLLAAQDLHDLAVQALSATGGVEALDRRGPLITLLRLWPGPWPAELAAQITAGFTAHFLAGTEGRTPDALLRSTLQNAALTFPPEFAEAAQELLAPVLAGEGAWRAAAAEFVYTLRFRRRMLESLAETAVTAATL